MMWKSEKMRIIRAIGDLDICIRYGTFAAKPVDTKKEAHQATIHLSGKPLSGLVFQILLPEIVIPIGCLSPKRASHSVFLTILQTVH